MEPLTIVLDRPASEAWRLQELELTSGAVVREIAQSTGGEARAMVAEADGAHVIVADDLGAIWSLRRVDLEMGEVTPVFTSSPTQPPAPIGGIVLRRPGVALLTAGGELLEIDFRILEAPRAAVLQVGLRGPRGLALDPLNPDVAIVAERDADRLRAVDLVSGSSYAIGPLVGSAALLPRPEGLAVGEGELLIVTDLDEGDGTRELRRLGPSRGAFELLAEGIPVGDGRPSVGPDGLRLLPLADSDDLAVGGGVEQVRAMVGFRLSDQVVTVDRPFAPGPRPFQSWRVRDVDRDQLVRAVPAGGRRTFLWDARDVPGGGTVQVRFLPADADFGVPVVVGPKVMDGKITLRTDELALATGGPVATGDLNGDGLVDIASGRRILYQTSPGRFESSRDLAASPTAVLIDDFDADGRLDYAASFSSNQVQITFQDSLGELSGPPLVLSEALDFPWAMTSADLNADGRTDLAVANLDSFTVVLFEQLAGGGFQRRTPDLVCNGCDPFPVALATGDRDGDGRRDLFLVLEGTLDQGPAGSLVTFLRSSSGAFLPPEVFSGVNRFRLPNDVSAADLDGDGRVELVLSARGSSAFTQNEESKLVLYRSGSATPEALGDAVTTNRPSRALFADLDGDRARDIVSSNLGGGDLALFFQRPGAGFDPQPDQSRPSPSNGDLAAADLDADGILDLLTPRNVHFRAAGGEFLLDEAGPMQQATATENCTSIVAADLDSDGDLDLATGTLGIPQDIFRGTVTVFFQTTPGVFERTPQVLEFFFSNFAFNDIAAGDLDSDGDIDLVAANGRSDLGQSGDLRLVVNTGSGLRFGPTLGGNDVTKLPFSVAVADLNGDRALDVVSANATSGTLTLFLQDAGVLPQDPSRTLTVPGGTTFVAAGDLDADGEQDLASANTSGNDVVLFFGTGSAGFSAPIILSVPPTGPFPSRPSEALMADLDGDGLLDLVTPNAGRNDLALFRQVRSPPRTFEPPRFLAGGLAEPVAVEALDVDADGDLDLACASGGDVVLLVQEEPLRFTAASTRLQPGSSARALFQADLDGDGDPDLASANSSSVTVFYGGR